MLFYFIHFSQNINCYQVARTWCLLPWGKPVMQKFNGTRNVQTVAKCKEEIIELMRKTRVENFLFLTY
jgi:hypothetical protein